jgi:hypothetical protein
MMCKEEMQELPKIQAIKSNNFLKSQKGVKKSDMFQWQQPPTGIVSWQQPPTGMVQS